MSVTSEPKIIKENGEDKAGLAVYFTNGALQQLEELKAFFNVSDNLETVKVAISFLQQIKEDREKNKKITPPGGEK